MQVSIALGDATLTYDGDSVALQQTTKDFYAAVQQITAAHGSQQSDSTFTLPTVGPQPPQPVIVAASGTTSTTDSAGNTTVTAAPVPAANGSPSGSASGSAASGS